MPILLTIAGYDPSSGAGITADLATFSAHGHFGLSAITALTVQSTLGVQSVHPTDPDVLRATLETLWQDTPAAGIKIGMLGSVPAAEVIAAFLKTHAQKIPVVLDPILRATSGAELAGREAIELLLPHATWATPNRRELEALAPNVASLQEKHPNLNLVVTGGDDPTPTDTLYLPGKSARIFNGEHIPSNATHGTGCAFSSALLANLVTGHSPAWAVSAAKDYVTEAIRSAPPIGQGKGPMNLLWPLNPTK